MRRIFDRHMNRRNNDRVVLNDDNIGDHPVLRAMQSRHSEIEEYSPEQHNSIIYPWHQKLYGVSTLYRCVASDAQSLYIFDSDQKLLQSDQYDIGGAYTENEASLWFFFTTSAGPGRLYLMNIFVCQRKPGMFSLGISDSNTLTPTTLYNDVSAKTLDNDLHWQHFHSLQPDEIKFIKTFQFSEEERLSLQKMVLVIPISITMNAKGVLNENIVKKIKADSEFGEKLFEDQEPDFIVTSSEGKEFRVHKVVLAAHSPILRDLVRADDCKTLGLDINNSEVELLLQYLYTGVIKDICNEKLKQSLMLADKFQLNNLKKSVDCVKKQ